MELRSDTDGLADLQTKMQEYLDNGAKLGWLIDPKHRRVYVYRQGQPLEPLEDPLELSGEDVVPGFILDLRQIWGLQQNPEVITTRAKDSFDKYKNQHL